MSSMITQTQDIVGGKKVEITQISLCLIGYESARRAIRIHEFKSLKTCLNNFKDCSRTWVK